MIPLDAFRTAALADARAEADRVLGAARDEASAEVDAARRAAAAVRDHARDRGRRAARQQLRRRVAEGRQQARERVLNARRAVLEDLQTAVRERLDDQRRTDEYHQLRERLVRTARQQLGVAALVEEDGEVGGIVASVPGRRVDYRLPVLVACVVEDMAAALEELWR